MNTSDDEDALHLVLNRLSPRTRGIAQDGLESQRTAPRTVKSIVEEVEPGLADHHCCKEEYSIL